MSLIPSLTARMLLGVDNFAFVNREVSKSFFYISEPTVFKPIHYTESTRVNCPETARLKGKYSQPQSQHCYEYASQSLPLGPTGECSTKRRPKWLSGALLFRKSNMPNIKLYKDITCKSHSHVKWTLPKTLPQENTNWWAEAAGQTLKYRSVEKMKGTVWSDGKFAITLYEGGLFLILERM